MMRSQHSPARLEMSNGENRPSGHSAPASELCEIQTRIDYAACRAEMMQHQGAQHNAELPAGKPQSRQLQQARSNGACLRSEGSRPSRK